MNWLNELRYTLKILGKNFRFTLLCVSVIFVGVAIVLPVYALIDNLALKTPSLASGDELVIVKKQMVPGSPQVVTRYDAFHLQTFREQATSFEALHAYRSTNATISDGEYAEVYPGAEIEPALLQRTQVQPLLGRALTPEDSLGAPVVLIGHDVWQSYYAGRADIVGHQSRINGESRTIVGVMPDDFGFPLDQRIWLPLAVSAGATPGAGADDLALVGVLANGVGRAEASTEIRLLQAAMVADWPEPYSRIQASSVEPYTYINVAGGNIETWGMMIVLGTIVLLVACNIGNLFVARGEERIQELAVRSALGATPARVAQSLLFESFVVCCSGLLAGWLWAWFGLAWLEGAMINSGGAAVTRFFWWDLTLNGRMVVISAAATMLVWLGSGGLPAWRISRANLNDLMNGGSKGLGEQGTTRVSRILVNMQLVLGSVLLTLGVTVVLLTFGLQITTQANSGSLYTARFNLGSDMQTDAQKRQAYIDALRQSLLDQPGVDGVAFTNAIPGGGSGGTRVSYNIEDRDLRVNELWPTSHRVVISDAYFDLMEVDLIEGRGFGAEDTHNGLPVAVVDRRLAEQLWPGASAIGKRLQLNPDADTAWLTIVGVAEPVSMEAALRADEAGVPVVYQPLRQAMAGGRLALAVGAADPAFDYGNTIRRAAAAVDRDIPFTDIRSLMDIEQARADEQALGGSAYYVLILVAMYLTAAATYGLAARAAGRRRIETGIRMALGASPSTCIRVFLKDGFRMVAYGLGIGCTLAILVTYGLLASVEGANYALGAIVPTALLLGLVMGGLVILANYFPARKIVAMEPADALRYE